MHATAFPKDVADDAADRRVDVRARRHATQGSPIARPQPNKCVLRNVVHIDHRGSHRATADSGDFARFLVRRVQGNERLGRGEFKEGGDGSHGLAVELGFRNWFHTRLQQIRSDALICLSRSSGDYHIGGPR